MQQDLVEVARRVLDCGGDTDDAARELLDRTSSPIAAIRALMDATGMQLAEAKPFVHRNLSLAVREETETLWDELEDALRGFAGGSNGEQTAPRG